MSDQFGDVPPASGPTPPPVPSGPAVPPPPSPGINEPWGHDGPPAGAPVLHSMDLGEVIDASIKLYRANWQVLAGIVAVFLIPLQILFALVIATENWVGLAFVVLAQFLVGPIMGGAIAKAAGDLYLGRVPDVRSSVNFTMRRAGPLLGVAVLTLLSVGLGFVALVIPGIFLLVRLYFASIAVVLEGQGASAGMQRSFELTKGRFWPLLGAGILIGILSAIVQTVVALPFQFGDSLVLSTIGETIGVVLVTPFGAVAAVLLYFDLRIRKEAFDLEVLAGHLGEEGQQRW